MSKLKEIQDRIVKISEMHNPNHLLSCKMSGEKANTIFRYNGEYILYIDIKKEEVGDYKAEGWVVEEIIPVDMPRTIYRACYENLHGSGPRDIMMLHFGSEYAWEKAV